MGLAKTISDSVISTVVPLAKTISDSVDTINTIVEDFSKDLNSIVEPVVKTLVNNIKTLADDINSSFEAILDKLLEISYVLKGNSDSKVSLQFEEQGVSSGNSRYTKCIFGYYRSKYLRRSFYLDFGVTDFDLSVDTSFFTVYGGGI